MIIVKNPLVFTPSYIPQKLLFREKEYELLINHLKVIKAGLTPSHLLLLGPPGTGKTVTVRKAIHDSGSKDLVIYTICQSTSFTTLINILEEITQVGIRGVSFGEAWKEFQKLTNNRPLIIILDEIDRLILPGKGEELLYYLSRRDLTSIIAISNRGNIYENIRDPRVRSSFIPRKIMFSEYNAEELAQIIEQRIKEGLETEIEERVVKFIGALAARAGGDARYAIDLLKKSIEIAIRMDEPTITIHTVESAKKEIDEDYIVQGILGLSEIEKTILLIIAKAKRITLSETYKLFVDISKNEISMRRFSDHIDKLEMLGYINVIRKGMGREKGVRFIIELSPNMNPELILKTLQENSDHL